MILNEKKLFFISFLLIISFSFIYFKVKSQNVTVSAIVPGVCGNGIKEMKEQCDGSDFGGQTCFNFGFSGGNLSCNSNCTINTSGCIVSSGGGGGGGGGGVGSGSRSGGGSTISFANLIVNGYAQPLSEVVLMTDGEIKATTKAGADSKFSFNLNNLSPGNYLITLYSEDKEGNRSSLYTFPIFLKSGDSITAGNILLSPTISTDKLEVKKGDYISIYGYAQKNADVLINVSSDEELFLKTNANDEGFYLYQLDTSVLDFGEHQTKSKSILTKQMISNYSRVVVFKISNRTIFGSRKCSSVDLNNDCRVNLIDFSILAYWYKKPKPLSKYDLNKDGKVDLIDFSILAYYWTG